MWWNCEVYRKSFEFDWGRLTCGGISSIKPSRIGKNTHETGLTLRIDAKNTNGDDLNILITGDQMYDYLDDYQLKNLDILVASHHGGTYSWSKYGCVPNARTKNSTVIYSCGKDNTYGHPSKANDYVVANWQKEHHTSFDGDFEMTIYL